MIQTTHTITLSFSLDAKGHPMGTIHEKTDPEWDARADFIDWLAKYGANKGSGAGAIFDATAQQPARAYQSKEPTVVRHQRTVPVLGGLDDNDAAAIRDLTRSGS